MKNVIKELRGARRWSQANLASLVKSSDKHIGRIERGEKEPRLSLAGRIAQAFDVCVCAVFIDVPCTHRAPTPSP